VKYGRAWWAKQCALKLIYGDWAEAYECLPAMLHGMKVKNPGMHIEYVPKLSFGQCVEAFMHCCDVLSIDGTILMGNYEGTLLNAIGINVDRQLVSLAFAIVEKENIYSWGWFLHLIQKVVVGPGCEVCVISDSHAGILNAVCEVIPNHAPTHHWWRTCHLAQNLIKHDDIKENFKIFEVCRQTDKKDFKKKTKGTREVNK
jgi:hypothetical protein